MNYFLKLLLVLWWEITGNEEHLKPEYKGQKQKARDAQKAYQQRLKEETQIAYATEQAKIRAQQDAEEREHQYKQALNHYQKFMRI